MFKILTYGIILFLVYRLFLQPKLEAGKPLDQIKNKGNVDDEGYTDYEEVE